MIRKECPDGQGAEDALGGHASSSSGYYASRVKVVFANEGRTRAQRECPGLQGGATGVDG